MAVKKNFIRRLRKIVGEDNVSSGKEDLIVYSYDGTIGRAMPDVVVHPGTVEDVSAIVRAACDAGVPIVPRGSGTGLSGGSLAAHGGIVLHFDRMNRLQKLSSRDLAAVGGPGLVNAELKKAAKARGLYYPPDPGSMNVCTMGGNVAENAGGPHGLKYGVTADYVLGLEVVLASGDVIRTGSLSHRDVSGYNLTGLMVGSEGTLGVVTEITVRLLPQPAIRAAAIYVFNDLVSAGEAVVSLHEAGINAAALEIIDRTAMECVERFRPGLFPAGGAAVLLVEVDGEPESVKSQMHRVSSVFESAGGQLLRKADGEASEELWEARRAVSAALGRMGPSKIGEDVSVPLSQVPEMINRIRQIAENRGLTIAVFGHAGDGNLHPNILTNSKDAEAMKKAEAAVSDLFEAAVQLGGSLSGEHGIGMAKAPYLKNMMSPETLDTMKRIKSALDPTGIMNPGKIFMD